jgi:hypothetical protein
MWLLSLNVNLTSVEHSVRNKMPADSQARQASGCAYASSSDAPSATRASADFQVHKKSAGHLPGGCEGEDG